MVSEVTGFLRKHNATRVLDLGCGLGRWSIALARSGFAIQAVDISGQAITLVREWARRENVEIDAQVIAAQDLIIENGSIDAVVCFSALDHLRSDDARRTLENVRKGLARGGVGIFTFDGPIEDKDEEFRILEDGTKFYPSGRWEGMIWRYYTDEEIRILFGGFEILSFCVQDHGSRDIRVRRQ